MFKIFRGDAQNTAICLGDSGFRVEASAQDG
jgi:hypothetical protein